MNKEFDAREAARTLRRVAGLTESKHEAVERALREAYAAGLERAAEECVAAGETSAFAEGTAATLRCARRIRSLATQARKEGRS